jgi:hypothetical protein
MRKFECLAVEMRWGIREEDANSHNTNKICILELQRCKEESMGISYVLITSNKYGYRACPTEIPKAELEDLLRHIENVSLGQLLELEAGDGPSALQLEKAVQKLGADICTASIVRDRYILDENSSGEEGHELSYVLKKRDPGVASDVWDSWYCVLQRGLRLAARRLWPDACTAEALRDAFQLPRARYYFMSVTEV